MGRFDQVRANLRRAYELRLEKARLDREAAANVEAEAPVVAPPPPDLDAGHPSTMSRDDAEIPRGLRLTAAWS